MGAKTAILAYVDGDVAAILKTPPPLDRAAGLATLAALFPNQRWLPLADTNLIDAYPSRGEIRVGCFAGLTLICHHSIVTDASHLDAHFLAYARGRTMLQHTVVSTVNAFAYGVWEGGVLRRSLAMDADNGVSDDIGARRAFEIPYWAGAHRDEDDNNENGIPFDPLDLGDAALFDLFGYRLEGAIGTEGVEPERVPLMRFVCKPWWRFW